MTDQLTADQSSTASIVDHVDTTEYRYPGSPPFADTPIGRLLFHGRTTEIDFVLHSILSVDLFLVYAVSGVGKTSLLTAGVLEPLRERGLFPVLIRLNDPTSSLLELIDAEIREAGDKAEGITVMRHPTAGSAEAAPSTLWDLLSTLEVWRGNTLQHLVLIFDQFEELFTLGWGDEQRERFIEEFGQVVRRHRTEPIDPDAAKLAALPPPNVKITILIREEFLGELEALAVHVPTIMQHRFRLDGLLPDQAKAAICAPAAVVDPRLATRRFTYSEGAAQAILDFLGAREERGRPVPTKSIDPCQLQIICQHIERSILPGKSAAGDPEAIVEISENDLGGRSGLERILRDFYRRELMSFPARQRKLVRDLCESGLINQSGRRLSLEEGEIGDKFKMPPSMLGELVSRRLLRAEPRVGSVYYELAHDSLAAPILAYREAARATRRRRVRWWIGGLVALAALVALVVLLQKNSSEGDATPQPITVSTSADDRATGTINEDVFEFEAVEGQQLIVEASPQGALDLWLDVTDPNGVVESASQAATGQPAQLVLVAPIPGLYQVTVSGSSGSFDLSVLKTVVPEIVLGEHTTGSIADIGEAQTFVFEQTGRQPFIVKVAPEQKLDAVLEVTDPHGVLHSQSAGGKSVAEVAGLSGFVAGRYRVVVRGQSPGTFELTVSTAEVKEVAVGEEVRGRVGPSSPVFVFEVGDPAVLESQAPGQLLAVELRPEPTLDGMLDVTESTGITVSADEGAGGDVETVVVESASGGPVRIVVSRYESTTGGFELSVRRIAAVEMKVGQRVSGTIGSDQSVAVFAFEATDSHQLLVELDPDPTLDAVLKVTHPDGWTDSVGGFSTGQAQLLRLDGTAGRYLVVVTGFESSTGDFELLPVRVDD